MTRKCFMDFELKGTSGNARRGTLTFPRGKVETPAFMPVGTYGTVKGMTPQQIEDIGADIILGNKPLAHTGVDVVNATDWQTTQRNKNL